MRNNNDDIKDIMYIINQTEKMKPTVTKSYDDYMLEEFEYLYNKLENRSDREHLMDLVRDFCSKPIF